MGKPRGQKRKARGQSPAGSERPPSRGLEAMLVPHRAGQFEEAAAAARKYTRRWPREPIGWSVLMESAAALGLLDEAIEATRQLARIDKRNAQVHARLGSLLQEAGHREEALAAYERALELDPGLVEVLYNVGNLLRDLDRSEEAVSVYRGTVERRPGWVEAHNNLGNTLRDLGRTGEAVDTLRRAVELRPRSALLHNNLAGALLDHGDHAGAETACRRALELDPEHVEAVYNLGRALALLQRPGDAESVWRALLEEHPERLETHYALANLFNELGRREEAEAAYRDALARWPDHARLHLDLAFSRRFEAPDADLERIEARLARGDDLSHEDLICLHYAAGKAWMDIGDEPGRAFRHLSEGARYKRETFEYDVATDERFFEQLISGFPAERLENAAGRDDRLPAPVFIVGMPRSGTTLVEQILATHSGVRARGELPDLEAALESAAKEAGQALVEWLVEAGPEALAGVGRAYREAVLDAAGDVARVTDKMPLNFRFAGVIAAALPHARIVHVRRDPVDTCLSCFMQLFTGRLDFTYDLAELGRYYRAYAGLMDHWRAVLPPGRMLEVRYEELVAEPEPVVRRLLDFCDLGWEPACLEFHRTERAVSTASATQVRQPLYQAAVGRWRAYREHLGPLLEALGPLAP